MCCAAHLSPKALTELQKRKSPSRCRGFVCGILFAIIWRIANIREPGWSKTFPSVSNFITYFSAHFPKSGLFFHPKKRPAEASLPLLFLYLSWLWCREPPGESLESFLDSRLLSLLLTTSSVYAPPHRGIHHIDNLLSNYFSVKCHTRIIWLTRLFIKKACREQAKVCLVQININVREAELLRKAVGMSYRGLRTFYSISGWQLPPQSGGWSGNFTATFYLKLTNMKPTIFRRFELLMVSYREIPVEVYKPHRTSRRSSFLHHTLPGSDLLIRDLAHAFSDCHGSIFIL